jgi:hypothetical protein
MAVYSPFLRRVLSLDALASGATGVLLAVGAGPLEGLLGLSPALTRPAGIFLIAYAAAVAWLASRPAFPRALIWTVIVGNSLWVIESLSLLVTGWVHPTGLGYAFVVAQAVVVALLAELQFIGLRRAAQVHA